MFCPVQHHCLQQLPTFPQRNVRYESTVNNKFAFKIIKSFNKFEITIFLVSIGHFQMEIKILNVDRNSFLSKTEHIAEGSYGKIYIIPFLGKEYAIKSYEMFGRDVSHFPHVLGKVIKEYCISKICDELGSGPAVSAPFGFDIFVFNNRI